MLLPVFWFQSLSRRQSRFVSGSTSGGVRVRVRKNEIDVHLLLQSKGGCSCNCVQLSGARFESWGMGHDF